MTNQKELKKSKSAEQLEVPKVELARSKSDQPSSFSDPKYPYTTLISQSQEIEELKKESQAKSATIKLLRENTKKLEQELESVRKNFTAQLTQLARLESLEREKENLAEQLKIKNSPKSSTELDDNLLKRHQNLKDWFTQYQKSKKLDKELVENVNEASQELLNQDRKISSLRTELSTLKRQKQSLSRDLELVQRVAESRKRPYLPENPPYPVLELIFYTLISVGFLCWLFKPQ